MKKPRRGSCPPFIPVLLAVGIMLFSVFSLIASAYASNVIPGSEVAPPGGSTTIATPQPTAEPTAAPIPQPTPEPTVPPVVPPTQEPIPTATVSPETNPPVQTPPAATEPTPSPTPSVAEDPVGSYPSKIDARGINIVSPSLDDLLADGADLEALLYPSGLKLPTKYMDLLMFAPVNYNTEVIDEAAYLLKTIAPVKDNTYTYAEYSAAQVYLGLCRLAADEENVSATANAVRSLDKNTSVNWMTNVTNATLGNSQRLTSLISNYKALLEQAGNGADVSRHAQYRDLVAEHRGVRYSCGTLRCFTDPTYNIVARDTELSAYVLGLFSWWDYIGAAHNLTSAVLTYSKFYDEFAYNNINYNKGAPAVSQQGNTGGNQPTNPSPENTTSVQGPDDRNSSAPVIVGGSSNGGGTTGGNNEWVTGGSNQGEGPITSVGNNVGTDPSILPGGNRDIKEVASIAAVIFVVVAVIALWAIHSIRKGQDPLTKHWK